MYPHTCYAGDVAVAAGAVASTAQDVGRHASNTKHHPQKTMSSSHFRIASTRRRWRRTLHFSCSTRLTYAQTHRIARNAQRVPRETTTFLRGRWVGWDELACREAKAIKLLASVQCTTAAASRAGGIVKECRFYKRHHHHAERGAGLRILDLWTNFGFSNSTLLRF